ncbi:MAG TPA: hypothetical protein PKO23_08795 [Candidatus Hydrogenedentes bacterium]|nr:hypothetical protein [Candidatus Hydrogenedentota bacterium]
MKLRSLSLICISMSLSSSCVAKPDPDTQHALPDFGANLPERYSLVYETDFSTDSVCSDFEFTDPNTWRLQTEDGEPCLELYEKIGDYTPEVRSPHTIALLTKFQVGDFVLEVDAESTNISAGAHRDTCYFFGLSNPSRFYYVHIASGADPNAHNIFLVKDAPRTNIATYTTTGIDWGVGIRHRIRIERTVSDGAIRVYFNDMTTPVMQATDTSFDWGFVGLGSFDDTAKFYALKLYAPETRNAIARIFTKKATDEVPSK